MFFSVTKLFQSQDVGLRRFLYLMIKEISPSSDEVRKSCMKLVPQKRRDVYCAIQMFAKSEKWRLIVDDPPNAGFCFLPARSSL